MPTRKLVMVMVDSLRSDMLRRAIDAGRAPYFERLVAEGSIVDTCASTFPSVTAVCCSELTTGVRPDRHRVPAMNWYHRAECRYVEYGSSFEATRAFGLFRALYDTVYNLNMAHLSPRVATVFERLTDAGVRTACTPFLVYRGRTRHEVGLEGIAKAAASAARFHHAVWGPEELFYGELYSSRPVDCKPTLARPGTRDAYSACVGEVMAADDLYDFLLFSLPDNDHHSHHHGPEATLDSIAHADACFGRLVEAHGGPDRFHESHAVILVADHAQSEVGSELAIIDALAAEWDVQGPGGEGPDHAELAVSPSARAAGVYVLAEGARREAIRSRSLGCLRALDGVEIIARLESNGTTEAVVERGGRELRFGPGSTIPDLRGNRWDLEGQLNALDLEQRDGRIASGSYPDVLARLWAALQVPDAADLLVSCAPGYECVDWGGQSHAGGGSHGALGAEDSLGPLACAGIEGFEPSAREQWAISDVAELVLGHFGLAPTEPAEASG